MVFGPVAIVETHSLQVGLAAIGSIAWVVAEYIARRSTWLQGAPRRPPGTLDHGTYPAIAISLAIGMSSTLVAFLAGLGGYLPVWVSAVGLVVLAGGLLLRGWALRTLGRFFTMPITLRPDHEIIRSGPYERLRHPAYTGGYLTAVGLALALGAPLGALVTGVGCLAAYVYRIHVEEATLVSRFGDDYRHYAEGTWRLLPPVY